MTAALAGPAPAPASLRRRPIDGLTPETGAVAELGFWTALDSTAKLVYLVLAAAPGLPVDRVAEAIGRSPRTVNGILGQLSHLALLDRPTRTVAYPRSGRR